jgi:hypothetical protein
MKRERGGMRKMGGGIMLEGNAAEEEGGGKTLKWTIAMMAGGAATIKMLTAQGRGRGKRRRGEGGGVAEQCPAAGLERVSLAATSVSRAGVAGWQGGWRCRRVCTCAMRTLLTGGCEEEMVCCAASPVLLVPVCKHLWCTVICRSVKVCGNCACLSCDVTYCTGPCTMASAKCC